MNKCLSAVISLAVSICTVGFSPIVTIQSSATNGNESITEGYYSYDAVSGTEEYVEEEYAISCANSTRTTNENSNGRSLSDPELVANDLSEYTEGDSDENVIEYSDSDFGFENSGSTFTGSNNGNTRAIYGGTDNRWKITTPSSYGQYRNTCRLRMKFSDNSYHIGTGFVLSDSAIATAGHCVYEFDTDTTNGNWVTSIEVWPAYSNGTKPYGAVTGTSFECGSAWKNSKDATQDWGIIQVSNNFPSLCGYLGLRWQSGTYVGTSVTVPGYPAKIGNSLETTVNGKYMYVHSNNVTWNSSSVVTYEQLDTSGGQSGAPVFYYSSDTGYTAIAIHRGQYNGKNSGVRLSEWLYNHMMTYR